MTAPSDSAAQGRDANGSCVSPEGRIERQASPPTRVECDGREPTAPDQQLECAARSIDHRKRAEALLAGEKRILEMMARGDSLSHVLDGLCRFVEEQAPGVLASVLLLDGDRLRHGGGPSL